MRMHLHVYAYVYLCVCITMLLCVSMCMYLHDLMCILYVHVFACICMYQVTVVVICVRLGYIEHYVLQSKREGTICFEILFYFSKGDSRVVRGPNHGRRVDVVQGAA